MADNSDGELQGWWPAKVISRSGDFVTCEFLGYEAMGRFTKPLSALSLIPGAGLRIYWSMGHALSAEVETNAIEGKRRNRSHRSPPA